MTYWLPSHIAKVYEALTAVADNRIEFNTSKNEAELFSSSRKKYYTITWNDDFSEMMANDKSAFFQGKLSYPMITVLLLKGQIPFNKEIADTLKNIPWKELNKQYKNKYEQAIEHALTELKEKGVDIQQIEAEVSRIYEEVVKLKIGLHGKKRFPPSGD